MEVGHDDLDRADRFEQRGSAGARRVLEGQAPAVWNAASEESTECALPSTRVTWTSTSGTRSALRPCSSWARTPFSTEPMNCDGTDPPTTLSTNCTPEPRGSGLTTMSQTAYWPCPPDCLTGGRARGTRAVNVSRSATSAARFHGAPVARKRSSTTSAWASPRHHSTS